VRGVEVDACRQCVSILCRSLDRGLRDASAEVLVEPEVQGLREGA
jgi:hypothetical protein